MFQIFGILKNFDVKTAQRWFAERSIPTQFVNLKEKEMSRGEFDSVVDAISREVEAEQTQMKDIRCRQDFRG